MRTPLPVTMVLVAVSLSLGGCIFGSREKKSDVEEADGLSNNPLKAMNQLAEAGQKMADKQMELAEKKPVDPVKFDVLIGLLPEGEGWTASEAKGETTAMAEWKYSTAERVYTKGDGKEQQRIRIEIIDGAYVPLVYAPFAMWGLVNNESTEGHSKGVTIDGFPGFEEFKKKPNDTDLTTLVDDRFIVKIEGDNVDPETARAWVAKVDLKKVAALD